MCTRCEGGIPRFDAFLEGRSLTRVFALTNSFSQVADRLAREALTYDAEWGKTSPDPVVFFRYEKSPGGWMANGEFLRDLFHPNEPGGDRKKRFTDAEEGMRHKGQAVVMSEDLGAGWNKDYIYVFNDFGDHIDGVAYEHRGSRASLKRTQRLLAERLGDTKENLDFTKPLFASDHIFQPADVLQAIRDGYDVNERDEQQKYLNKLEQAVDQFPLLKKQYEDNVADLAQRVEEQFVTSDVGTKFFSDVAQTMVQSLEQSEALVSVESTAGQKNEAQLSSAEQQLVTREPVAEVVGTVAGAAKSAIRDTTATTVAVGARAIEHICRKKHEKQKVDNTKSSTPLPETRNYSHQFAQRIPIQEPDKKPMKEHKHAPPKRVVRELEKIASFVTSPLKKKENTLMKQPKQVEVTKREIKRKIKTRFFMEKRTKKNIENKTFFQIRRKIRWLERRVHKKERHPRPLLIKESKPKAKKKEVFILKKEKLWQIAVALARRIRKSEIPWIQKKKDTTIAPLSIEKKKSQRKEKKLAARFAFAWALWLLLRNNREKKRRNYASIDRSKTRKIKELYSHQQSHWVLFAIIWYLVMIREQRMSVANKKMQKKNKQKLLPKSNPLPSQAVIFAFQ